MTLNFVSNHELRDILQRDIAELSIACSQDIGKTAKTCMILCGSIAEAILLGSLLQHKPAALAAAATLPKKLSANLEEWTLDDMIMVATRIDPPLLPEDAIAGATQIRLWRNLIHPGRELREARNKRIKPSKARARNAIAFLQFVLEELSP